jgi:hypothetical protein
MQHIPSLEGRLAGWDGLNVPMHLTVVASLPRYPAFNDSKTSDCGTV